ncbi:class I SAM-dependent methyltransferase [Patescibacteria group bacterium AH-259-L05]|nr:class I SAM-dependent methyltransferase [Patescibacteria group bacterium AH-259-L05]
MNSEEIQKLYKFEQFYWWHVGRRKILSSLLRRFLKNNENQILEIGCGTGGNLEVLSRWGKVTGLDISEEALNFCRKRGFNNLILSTAERINVSDKTFDLVVAMDVLEHIENDKKAIKETWRILKPGGYFLATVPAYQFLWSEHDEVLHHHRRYLFSSFLNKMQDAGFDIIKMSYIISFVFPIVLVYRTARKIFPTKDKKNIAYITLPKFINNFFVLALQFEAFLLRFLNFPFGVSIICIAQKSSPQDYARH